MSLQTELQEKAEELGVDYARAEDYSKAVGGGHWLDALKALFAFLESLRNNGVVNQPSQEYQKQYNEKRENQQRLQEEHDKQMSGENIKESDQYRQAEQKTQTNRSIDKDNQGKDNQGKDNQGPGFDKDQLNRNQTNIVDVEQGAKEQDKERQRLEQEKQQKENMEKQKQQDEERQKQVNEGNVVGESKQQEQPKQQDKDQQKPQHTPLIRTKENKR